MLLALSCMNSCRAAPPPPIDWPKVVRGTAELGILAQRHGQTIIVCLVGDAPNAVVMQAPSGAEQPSAPVQEGKP